MPAEAATAPGPARAVRVHRSWRAWRVGPLTESSDRVRLLMTPAMLAVQLFLYDRLWTSVYRGRPSAGGLDVRQAVSYALLALLAARIRWSARTYSRDNASVRVRDGTIAYWFLRPISPGRYYMWRQTGDMAYGFAWAVLGYAVLLATHAVEPPRGAALAAVFLLSLTLGQSILYYLGQLIDLSTFWTVSNDGLVRVYYFVQDLLSGVFVPVWFMPAWLIAATRWLPFNAGINVPVSLYVGRIPLGQAGAYLGLQLAWALALAALTRWLWSRAARRLTVQGG
jgi:ABC-2 type transport system permease protein